MFLRGNSEEIYEIIYWKIKKIVSFLWVTTKHIKLNRKHNFIWRSFIRYWHWPVTRLVFQICPVSIKENCLLNKEVTIVSIWKLLSQKKFNCCLLKLRILRISIVQEVKKKLLGNYFLAQFFIPHTRKTSSGV